MAKQQKTKKNNVDYNVKILEVKNLKKYFRIGSGKSKLVVPAVDDVSFDIYKREIFGLVGESGSGKTTTGRTIIKLYNPTEGTVTLNGLQVSAGHMEYVQNIAHIKENLKNDLISLYPQKVAIRDIKNKLHAAIEQVELERAQNSKKYDQELAAIEADIIKYKEESYRLFEQHTLSLENVKYQFILNKDNIQESTLNQRLKTYNEEVNIEKNRYAHKYDGLKESAALSKAEIRKRLDELKQEHEAELSKLELSFKDLIVEGETNAVDKKVAKEQIQALRAQYIADTKRLKKLYEAENAKIKKPDYNAYKENLKKLKSKYKDLNQALNLKIKDFKAKAKLDIKNVLTNFKIEKLSEEQEIQRKLKIQTLKQQSKADILTQKQKIASSKEINKSKEALNASRMMQMIFQDPISSLNPRMTVREIIGEGLIISGQYTKEEIDKRVEDILNVVGLASEYATRYPHEFSGGQRQRIGIARALIMNPNFIIADEPISALDVSIQAQVINLISELKDILDLTVLFIAHDLSVVRFFCDRVAVMHNGKIVEMADTDELFKNPTHPYTKSLLSAIPQPDPDYEKGRSRIHYNPAQHDYRTDKPKLKEISARHYVYVNDKEFSDMKVEYLKNNEVK